MANYGVLGAGAIGCYLGGKLLAAGQSVTLVGRESLREEVERHGLTLSDFRGGHTILDSAAVSVEAAELSGCNVVFVTVKSGDTHQAAQQLEPHLKPDALVVSFQNGVSNTDTLRERLPGRQVLGGVVQFNVERRDGAHFHLGSSGRLTVQRGSRAPEVAGALKAAGLPVHSHRDIRGVLWGKLLINLNNAVNALSGVPIRDMIADRDYRRVMASCAREGIQALSHTNFTPRLDMPAPAALIPRVLELPDGMFRLLARPLFRVGPDARSSMADDLKRHRKTEIDFLNGEVVRLAERVGTPARCNETIIELVKAAEGRGTPALSGSELARRCGLS